MNAFIINGSPRGENSNTLKLTQAFLDGTGICDFNVVQVAKLDIKPCRGCFGCWKATPGVCVIKDDMQGVLEKLKDADLVVWSFPLYYFSVPGVLKNLIDRQLPFNLPFMTGEEGGGHPSRYDSSRKRHVVISTCGFYTSEGNYEAVDAMFARYCSDYEKIYCAQGELFSIPELRLRTDEYLSYVKQAGAEYAGGGILLETRQKLKELLYPKDVFERMADASWGIAPSADDSDSNADSPSEAGAKADESLTFTRQMAALYNKANYDKDRIIEMNYTDIGKRYQIHLSADGATVETENLEAASITISTPITVWQAIARGEIEGSAALAQGKYSVTGDFSVMLKWDELFGLATPTKTQEPSAFRSRAKFINGTNIAGAAAFAAFLVSGANHWFLLAVQLFFALFWGVTVFMKVPMTCYFSAAGYGGGKMLKNPLFTRTNRILTACWAIEYLLMAIVLMVLHFSDAPGWFAALTYVPAPLLGIFTGWFAKWYPAKMAMGKQR
ncbi:MAG: NAD(P)H-dependent oxidoreductase [Clostridiales Family XIII bacterium]|jgi:multimeric flavodoxin WrbA/putative sterol carrier protein|nr:NAD(P)H-dependent oxidoreductase [Clostridiales Family XIII bacterium]